MVALHDVPQPLLSRSSISWPQDPTQDEVRGTGMRGPFNVFPPGSEDSSRPFSNVALNAVIVWAPATLA